MQTRANFVLENNTNRQNFGQGQIQQCACGDIQERKLASLRVIRAFEVGNQGEKRRTFRIVIELNIKQKNFLQEKEGTTRSTRVLKVRKL